ncbi:ABC transporter permease subunit [Bacillus sp. NEB1478]|uniref:ABC transporter permease subunit n=1 Tax=Bacillus sp. NEB1478 TaxID=3073816 RepID=UPI002872CBFF|nr:ABC transporter permease subunit [Bacillus sp. NEB1478]WNB91586.1 ABC transporter permease subunit [Bacillus sp. NEB1478]
MRKFIFSLKQILLLGISIILLSSTPSFFVGEDYVKFSISHYINTVSEVMVNLLNPNSLTLYTHSQTLAFAKMPINRSVVFLNQISERPLFPEILDMVFYILCLLLASFAITFLSVVLFGWIIELLPSPLKKAALWISDLLEALPDLFFVFCVQLAVVWIYRQTGWLAANPFTTSEQPPFLLPAFTMSIVPGIYLFRFQLLLSQQEMEKDYVTFAKSKGLSKSKVIFQHITKNTVRELTVHLPFIMLLLFSQMVVVEYLFNMNGVIRILLSEQPAETRAMILLLITIPLAGTIKCINMFVRKEKFANAA